MADRPSWFTRKKLKLRRMLYRRLVLPLLNRQLRRLGLHLYRYDAQSDRLRTYDAVPWEAVSRPSGGNHDGDRWYHAVRARVADASVILDIGGGGGATSTWFSRWADLVCVFEPSPANRELIRTHHRIRAVRNAEIIAAAVGDVAGEATLHLKQEAGHNSLGDIGASATVDRIRVPVTTLDAFADERGIERVGLLKIDVEGFEPEVIRGGDRLLRERRVDLVVFEFSPAFYRQRGIRPLAVVEELEERGYRVLTLDGTPIDSAALERSRQTDLLAVPRSD
jgi:FkbM family methyltransferase